MRNFNHFTENPRIPFDAEMSDNDTSIIVVYSSNGEVLADRSGNVISVHKDWRDSEAAIPAKFDFAEYEKHYGHPVPNRVDILDLGFISWDGIIVEPAHDWREIIRCQL